MKFGDAMQALLEGRRIKRVEWPNYKFWIYYDHYARDELGHHLNPFFLAKNDDGWMVIDDEPRVYLSRSDLENVLYDFTDDPERLSRGFDVLMSWPL